MADHVSVWVAERTGCLCDIRLNVVRCAYFMDVLILKSPCHFPQCFGIVCLLPVSVVKSGYVPSRRFVEIGSRRVAAGRRAVNTVAEHSVRGAQREGWCPFMVF